jgi:hypothetical protein
MLLAAERWERAETTVLRALGLEAEPAGHWLAGRGVGMFAPATLNAA